MLQLYSVKVHVPIDWDQEIMNTHRPCIQHLSHVSVLLSMLQLYCMGLYMLRVDWEQGAVSNRMSIASRLCLTSHQCTGSSQLYRAECDEWIESSKHCTHTQAMQQGLVLYLSPVILATAILYGVSM